MPSPLPSLTLPSPPTRGRKRSHSSLEILSLSPPYDIKRARFGIQELSTEDSPPLPSLVNSVSTVATAESPETQESASDTSSDELLDPTSSSSSDSSIYYEVDEGYDSDTESGDTSTSSSSTSSYDSDEESSPRSASMDMSSPAPAQLPSFPSSSLSTRLTAFLPSIAAANAQLDQERQQGTLAERDIEKVDDEHYIEMDLGLGVLEEKSKSGQISDEDSMDDDSMVDPNDAEDESEVTDGASLLAKRKKKRVRQKEKDIIGKLMGRQKVGEGERPDITIVEAGASPQSVL